jgi:predicted nucleic acid-binding protein
LTLTLLNEFEFEQTLRMAVWRKALAPALTAQALAVFEAERRSGRLVMAVCNLADVIAEARRLSGIYTLSFGYRAFDILHVAAALHLGADRFLTFDVKQRRLAHAEKLKVGP